MIVLFIMGLYKFKRFLENYVRDLKESNTKRAVARFNEDEDAHIILKSMHKQRMVQLRKASSPDTKSSIDHWLSADINTKD